jgi:threonine-phosphate decarboxylase
LLESASAKIHWWLTLRVRKELEDIYSCEHGGRLSEVAGRLGVEEASLIDFSVNLNPYVPDDAREAVRRAYGTVYEYPDNRYGRFRESAARFAGVHGDNIIPGNGSMEIIRLVAEAVVEKGDIVAIPCPTFGEYEQQCRLFGAGIRYMRTSDLVNNELWHLKGCRVAFFCNPNNPDGRLLPAGDVESILRYCQDNDVIAVVDEAFIDLADPEQSVAGLVEKYDNLLVMRSLTKCFAIPGLRLGFGIACREAADVLNKARLTWNLDGIAAGAGIYFMDNAASYLEVSRSYIKREREWLMGRIGALNGVAPQPASANYFLVDVSGTGMTSGEFADRMLREHIIVRDCSSFKMQGDSYIRIAVRSREDNERLVEALGKVAGARL